MTKKKKKKNQLDNLKKKKKKKKKKCQLDILKIKTGTTKSIKCVVC